MKIVLFNESITLAGGVERVVCTWANMFSQKGDEISILNVFGDQSFFPLNEGINVLSLNNWIPPRGWKKLIRYPRIIFSLRKFLKKNQPDFFVANSVALGCSSLCAKALLRKNKTKFIICDHNKFFSAGKIWRILRKRLYKNAFAVISLTKAELPKYQEIGCHAVNIPNPLPWPVQDEAKKDKKTALAVGRFTVQKGFDLLLLAWKKVSLQYPDWKLEIIGGGEDENKLIKLRAELQLDQYVDFIPSKKNVQENYLNASLFILSSRYEGLPVVLLEAKSFGLSCVSFNCETGPNEIIRDGVDGYLAQPENPDDLAEKIIQLISSPEKIREFGKNAHQDAEKFTPDRIMGLWEKVIPLTNKIA